MRRPHPFAQVLLPGITAAFCAAASTLTASTWTGGNGNWSSNGVPGWNSTGVPNAQGAVADFNSITSTTIQDNAAGVTVGTLRKVTGSPNSSWTITLTNAITFDQDGAGSGSALIENASTTVGAHRIIMSAGTVNLADNLIIRNSGGSNSSSGSINISSNLTGTGNVTFDNVSNNAAAGQIAMLGGTGVTSSFTGTVFVRRGAVAFNDKDHFGNQAGNTIILGETGQGSTTLVSSAAVTGAIVNNIVSTAGTGGTNVLGSISAATSGTTSFAGTILLNGNLTVTGSNTGAGSVALTGVISGVGSLTKTGDGIVRIGGVNTYTGDTTVSAGSLLLLAGSEQRFVIADGNESNQLLGTGALDLNGTLRLDISGLSATSGTWNLVDAASLTETYGSSFGLAFVGGPAFVDTGSGSYTSGVWTFNTITGNLTLVPEPGSAVLLALGGALIGLAGRRRTRAS